MEPRREPLGGLSLQAQKGNFMGVERAMNGARESCCMCLAGYPAAYASGTIVARTAQRFLVPKSFKIYMVWIAPIP